MPPRWAPGWSRSDGWSAPGCWRIATLNTGEEWSGQDTFTWIDDGMFLAFNDEEHGRVNGLMVIGRETRWGADTPREEVLRHWFDSSTGEHFIYIGELTAAPRAPPEECQGCTQRDSFR